MSSFVCLNFSFIKHELYGFISVFDETEGPHNLEKLLLWGDNSVDFIYIEDYIEQLNQGNALKFFCECRRILKPHGIIRVATYDLDSIVESYSNFNTATTNVNWMGSRAELFNLNLTKNIRWFYNEEDLVRITRMAGFLDHERQEWGVSRYNVLNAKEHNVSSTLILEFSKIWARLNTDTPLVSVLIPAWKPDFLTTTLTSILNQSYKNLEIIIFDDCRSDDVRQVVNQVLGDDPRVSYFHNTNRLFSRLNYIRCLEQATGPLIKYLNDDDVLLPDCIARMVAVMRENPDVTLVTSRRKQIDEHDRIIDDVFYTIPPVDSDSVIEGESLAKFVIFANVNLIGEPSTVLFYKEDLMGIRPNFMSFGGYQIGIVVDVAMWVNLLLKGNMVYLTEVLSYFRIHDKQAGRVGIKQDPKAEQERRKKAWPRLCEAWRHFDLSESDIGQLLVRPLDSLVNQWQKTDVKERYRLFNFEKNEKAFTPKKIDLFSFWQEKHALSKVDGQILEEGLQTSNKWPNLLFVCLLENEDIAVLADTIESLSRQYYKQWSLVFIASSACPDPLFDEIKMVHWIQAEGELYGALNQVLANVDAFDWVAVIPPGLVLAEQALSIVANYINLKPQWYFVFCDEDSIGPNEKYINPLFKPDINLDLLRSTPYLGDFCLVRKSVIDELGGYCGLAGVLNWDLGLKVYERLGSTAIGHVPEILCHNPVRNISDEEQKYFDAAGKLILARHFERLGLKVGIGDGLVQGSYFIDYPLINKPLVSVIITVLNTEQLNRLSECIKSMIENTEYGNFEIIVTSVLPVLEVRETLNQFSDKSICISNVLYQGDVISPLSNKVIYSVNGDFVLLFSPDLLVLHSHWLEILMAQGLRNEVGIVGARIIDSNKNVHHAGLVLGMGDFGVADYINRNLPMNQPGYMNRAVVLQNMSAVSTLCFLMKKEILETIPTYDGNLFDHVDFCLSAAEQGFSIVWTPFVTLMLRKQQLLERKMDELRKDADEVIKKWLPQLANDPAYNRNLSLKHRHFQIETETDVTWNVDFHDRLRIYAFPANDSGVGEYRVRAPLRALTNAAMIQSSLLPNHSATLIPDIVEIERVQPDVLLLQNGTANYLIHAWEQYKRFNSVFRIYSQDDLVFALPGKHPLQAKWPKDMRKRLRKLMENSDRLIVANEPLKEAYSRWIDDIKIVPNYLESSRWLDLSVPQKQRSGNKLRVGWAGGAQHHGDLEFIIPVVESLKDEVDWIFMGMCPDRLKPIIKEYHGGVPFDFYPQKLAELDLDLAIAPLEYNNFNAAKTNLRLLEYGVLGWPVVCSDILPYQNAPVTLVGNNTQYWLKAIREKIGEPEALRAEGKVLQQWVLDNYLLEDHLDDWLQALMP